MNTKKFTMLGESGSGKTCYLLGMYMSMNMDLGGIGYTIVAKDEQVRKNLTTSYYKLEDDGRGESRFPDTTDNVQKYTFWLQYAYETILPFEWIDYPGAFLDPTQVDTTDAKYKEVEKSISESSTIFICIDGSNLVEGDIYAKIRRVKRKCTARINPYLGNLKEKLKREGRWLPPICIIVTKFDLCGDYVSMDKLRDIIVEAFKPLFMSDDTFVTVIPVSLGIDITDDDYKGELDPVNIHLPILFGIHFALDEVIDECNFWINYQNEYIEDVQRAKRDEEDSFFLWRSQSKINDLAKEISSTEKELKELIKTANIAKKNQDKLMNELNAVNMVFYDGRWIV